MQKLSIPNRAGKRVSTIVAIAVLLVTAVTLGLYSQRSSNALSGGVEFTHFATHPYASKTGYDKTSTNYYTGQKLCNDGRNFCPAGQLITDIGITNGELVAGYGDWGSNVDTFGVSEGGVYVVPLNLDTNTWGSNPIRAGSEALDVIREIDGAIYAPTTDPSNIVPTGQTSNGISGYVTNEGGNWRFVRAASNVHTFDVAKLPGKGIWTVGSDPMNEGHSGVAVSYHSSDNGATWQLSTKDDSNPPGATDWERYYWIANRDGKLYVQGAHIQPSEPAYKIYDNDQWTSAADASQRICESWTDAKLVESFKNNVVCGTYSNGISVFDGATTSQKALPGNVGVKDFYATSDTLYVLARDNKIYKTSDLGSDFEYIGVAGSDSSSSANAIAVHAGYVYLGGEGGKIWRSTTTMDDAPEVSANPIIRSISPQILTLDSNTKQIIIKGEDFGSAPTVKLGTQQMDVSNASDTQIEISVDTSKFSVGKYTIEVVGLKGTTVTKQNAIEFTEVPVDGVPTIQSVKKEVQQDGSMRLRFTGSNLLQPLTKDKKEAMVWAIGLRTKLVSVNGVPLSACASESSHSVLKNYYNANYFTTNKPCYELINYDVTKNKVTLSMTDSEFTVVLPSSHAARNGGSVKLMGGSFGGASLRASDDYRY